MDGETGATAGPPRAIAQSGIHEKVLEIFRSFDRGTVLDAPAGEGALSLQLKNLGYRVTACDIVGRFMAADIPFLRLDLDEDLPFPDASFDYTACLEGIEHVENPYQLIREFTRVLKPGGALVLSTPNVLSIRSRVRFFFSSHHRRFKGVEKDGHLTPVSYRELHHGFKKAGLEIELITTNRFRRKWGIFYPILRSLVRAYTRRNHPLGREIVLPEILDGAILILVGRKGIG